MKITLGGNAKFTENVIRIIRRSEFAWRRCSDSMNSVLTTTTRRLQPPPPARRPIMHRALRPLIQVTRRGQCSMAGATEADITSHGGSSDDERRVRPPPFRCVATAIGTYGASEADTSAGGLSDWSSPRACGSTSSQQCRVTAYKQWGRKTKEQDDP